MRAIVLSRLSLWLLSILISLLSNTELLLQLLLLYKLGRSGRWMHAYEFNYLVRKRTEKSRVSNAILSFFWFAHEKHRVQLRDYTKNVNQHS